MSLISYVTRIHFADEVLEAAVEAELEELDHARPLIVADRDPGRRELVGRLLASLPETIEPAVFELSACRASEADCEAAALLYRRHRADVLIGFGGPAAINVVKGTAIRTGHDGPIRQFAGAHGAAARIRDPLPPIIAIPTTPASCAETVGVGLLALQDGSNATLASPYLTPRVVICDPTLTMDLGSRETAAAGMDALTHCVETYVATAYNPPADGIARDGIRRIAGHLERSVADGMDLDARREMMAAALNGALAHQKGLGGVHALSNALGSTIEAPLDHGALNGILLPVVLAFNAPAVSPRYEEIKREMGLSSRLDLGNAIAELRERLCLPARLADMGVERADLPRAAILATGDYANRTNPRRAEREDYLSMLRLAW